MKKVIRYGDGLSVRILTKKLESNDTGRFNATDQVIELSEDISGELWLDTLLHECIHLLCPYLAEDEVRRIGTDLARISWECGVRPTKKKSPQGQ